MRLFILTWIAFSFSAATAQGQDLSTLTGAYPDDQCGSCAEWNAPQAPFRIYGNTYFVGTGGLSSILITSPEGHVLIDGALPNSAPQILASVRALGFELDDIELILNSHAHFDHAGGLAALREATGGRVAASPASASVIERGRSGPDDPQFGTLLDFPPVPSVERFTPGDTLRAGSIEVRSHATAGHTPGGTSWSWTACEDGRCVDVVYADSQTPISSESFRFTDSTTYPSAISDFEYGFEVLESISCDIMISTHPNASSLLQRLDADGREGLIDTESCRNYAAAARRMLADRIEREKGTTTIQE